MSDQQPSGSMLPANRVVLIFHLLLTVLTIVGILIAAIENALPKNWQNGALALAGVVSALTAGTVAVLKFLDGSQKWDQLVLGPPGLPQADGVDSGQSLSEIPESAVSPDGPFDTNPETTEPLPSDAPNP